MSRRLGILLGLLALVIVSGAEAQSVPFKAWPNDQLGRPAPPCMVLDPTTGITTPCSTSTPIPTTGGSGAGQGATSGTSVSGFGKQWYPSTITGTGAAGQAQAAVFVDDLQVAFARRSTGCASCLQIALSTDGGVTGTYVSTAAIIGNDVRAFHRIPSSPTRYIVANVVSDAVFSSGSLVSGWTAVPSITFGAGFPVEGFASNAGGTTTLALIGRAAGLRVCRSTNAAVSFASCVDFGATAYGGLFNEAIAFAGGTTWLAHDNAGNIWRSTDDGLTFATVTTAGGNGRAITCLGSAFNTCLYTASDGNVRRSTDSGATWTIVTGGLGASSGLCDYGGGNAAILTGALPTGFAAIAQNAFSSNNSGQSWYPGQTFGSAWDGTGAPSLLSFACRAGRGSATFQVTGGGAQQLALYNPLTAPGGTLQSSAGGYQVAAPIQSGVILNAVPTTSGANAAAAVTATGTAGSRVCVRRVVVFPTGGAGTFTLNIADSVTGVIANFGTITALAAGATVEKEGTPLACGQTSSNLVVNIGAAGVGITTTTTVIADRYPN